MTYNRLLRLKIYFGVFVAFYFIKDADCIRDFSVITSIIALNVELQFPYVELVYDI